MEIKIDINEENSDSLKALADFLLRIAEIKKGNNPEENHDKEANEISDYSSMFSLFDREQSNESNSEKNEMNQKEESSTKKQDAEIVFDINDFIY
ncbi:MAG: hypothetical protein PWQ28_814 [Candidatus Woesearchaeota archaeon]|nr:hypothetical protein [Candidatus Woesearchaeota archaeon]